MKLQTLLEQLLKEDIEEVAIPIKQAQEEQLALAIKEESEDANSIILYNPQAGIRGIAEAMERNEEDAELELTVEEAFKDRAIVGYLSFVPLAPLSPRDGKTLFTVSLSGADSGYGPLLYDLALSAIYPSSLTSDRNSVSKDAQRIWQYYFNKRRDVNKQLIPGADDIRQYGKLVPTVSAGGGTTRAVVHAYHQEEIRIKRFEDWLQQAEKMNLPSEQKVESQKIIAAAKKEQLTLVEEYKKGIMYNPLAYQYSINKRLNISALVSAHTRFTRYLQRKYGFSASETEDILDQAGETFARESIP